MDAEWPKEWLYCILFFLEQPACTCIPFSGCPHITVTGSLRNVSPRNFLPAGFWFIVHKVEDTTFERSRNHYSLSSKENS